MKAAQGRPKKRYDGLGIAGGATGIKKDFTLLAADKKGNNFNLPNLFFVNSKHTIG